MKTLHLNLKRKWFDMILSGDKDEEYREIKPHWANILISNDRDYMSVAYWKGFLGTTENNARIYRIKDEVYFKKRFTFQKFDTITFF